MAATGRSTLLRDRETIDFVRRAAKSATRVASVCSGSVILARAGLLDGKRAATHWSAAEAMAKNFPGVTVERDAIYVQDGKYWTSAGVTAGMDWPSRWWRPIWAARRPFHRAAACSLHDAAGRAVAILRRVDRASGAPGQDREAAAYVLANLSKDLGLAALAAKAGLSERSCNAPSPMSWARRPRNSCCTPGSTRRGGVCRKAARRSNASRRVRDLPARKSCAAPSSGN